ncbi:Alpha/Beta hydrolase protein [Penicillium manginii]|uniref:Alpha/Beta hydrolase protein n=1 Tax=Penicillium manginii TaxID=203109 RepID=UPI00254901F4|nr:Alpha/Beta hydrolase protein [Penicillium manginii]KAJ5744242.1 Alpha/Beta hydrolase protein [Penicillium manginii]
MARQLPEGGQTLVYSTVDDHEIKLDYYLPRVNGALPAVIYYHGGGMTAGSRRGGLPRWLYAHCQEKGYIFISADYRLCHPTTALDQIEDAKNLFQFITSAQFDSILPESITLDSTRIAVSGFSAGAYSARAACIYANPKPAALISVYGLGGNVLLDHWTRARPPTSIAKFVDLNAVPELLADKTVVSDDVSVGGPLSRRFALTVHWELSGTMLDGIFGRDGLGRALDRVDYEQRAAAFPSDLKSGLLQSFVDDSYPPSIFVHGTADEVVPPQESIDHHEQLKGLGIKSELLFVEDGPHGLEAFSTDPTSVVFSRSNEAYSKALSFIDDVFSGLQNSTL